VKHVIKNPNFPKVVQQRISGAFVDLIPSLSAVHLGMRHPLLTLVHMCESYVGAL